VTLCRPLSNPCAFVIRTLYSRADQ
jgi:hypothetical protein